MDDFKEAISSDDEFNNCVEIILMPFISIFMLALIGVGIAGITGIVVLFIKVMGWMYSFV